MKPALVKIQTDGSLVVGASGWVNDNSGHNISEILVTRFSSTGSLDTSFGVNGAAIVPYALLPRGSECNGMAFEPDGRIVVAGVVTVSGASDQFEVARFLATGPQIDSFWATQASQGGAVTLTASTNDAEGNPGAKVTQVEFYYFDNSGTKISLGYGVSDGKGGWTFTTNNLATGTYTLFAQAEDSYGMFGDPLATTITVN
jgi:hypothetical protein